MKTLIEIMAKFKLDYQNKNQKQYIDLCNGVHPLMFFIPRFFKPDELHNVIPLTRDGVISEMQGYINFAIKQVKKADGFSEQRSLWIISNWLWILEDDMFDIETAFNDNMEALNKVILKYDLQINEEY